MIHFLDLGIGAVVSSVLSQALSSKAKSSFLISFFRRKEGRERRKKTEAGGEGGVGLACAPGSLLKKRLAGRDTAPVFSRCEIFHAFAAVLAKPDHKRPAPPISIVPRRLGPGWMGMGGVPSPAR